MLSYVCPRMPWRVIIFDLVLRPLIRLKFWLCFPLIPIRHSTPFSCTFPARDAVRRLSDHVYDEKPTSLRHVSDELTASSCNILNYPSRIDKRSLIRPGN